MLINVIYLLLLLPTDERQEKNISVCQGKWKKVLKRQKIEWQKIVIAVEKNAKTGNYGESGIVSDTKNFNHIPGGKLLEASLKTH